MPHVDFRHPYDRFVRRLASPAGARVLIFSRFRSHRPRLILYGSLIVLLIATLVWSGQRTHGLATASADSLSGTANTLAAARAKALEASPLTPIELLKKAAPLIDGPNRATAIELLTEANRRDPTIRDVNLQLGYAYIKDGRWTDAKATLNRAKELDSIYPETYQLLAGVNHQLGDTSGEQEALARAKQFELVAKLPELTK